MSTQDMTNSILEIHGQIMFDTEPKDYSELLAAVEDLRYFLREELHVIPLEFDRAAQGDFDF
ncbi:MAG: hypothetical protein IJ379_09690 [Lachnospiraceae bacterium]|nr:hypothetical protein [Lachnospiraceae bacterium]